jgi:hypothetical protein
VYLSHFLIIYFVITPAGLKKSTTHRIINKNILDEMNINKAREIQIVSNPFSSLLECFVPVQ